MIYPHGWYTYGHCFFTLSYMTLLVINTTHIYTSLMLYTSEGTLILFNFTSPSFYKDTMSAKALMANINHVFEHPGLCTHFSHYSVGHNQVIMAVSFNDNHIIYSYMYAQCSIGLRQTLFTSPDYMVVQCWTHSTFLHPNTINTTEPNMYHYTKFFEGVVGYIILGFPCN